MNLAFLTPWAAAVALLAGLAAVLLLRTEQRSRSLCAVLGLEPRPRRSAAVDAAGLLAVAGMLGLAAAQPVVSDVRTVSGRTDAEVIAVFDVSRSMLGRARPSDPTRLQRARSLAKEIRAGLSDVPVGVSSLTDRLLPHLFPTLSANAFTATVDRAVAIERPPPDRRTRFRATALGALGDLGGQNFFGRGARARVAVVFTDGESVPYDLGALRARLLAGRVGIVVVHVTDPDDRVYASDGSTERYRPDPRSRAVVDRLAAEVNGAAFPENDTAAAVDAIRRRLGDGPRAVRGRDLRAVALAPYAVAAAGAPLLLVLLRRNF